MLCVLNDVYVFLDFLSLHIRRYCYGQLIEFAAYVKIRYMVSHDISLVSNNKNDHNSKQQPLQQQQQQQQQQQTRENIEKFFYFSTQTMIGMLALPSIFVFVILYFSDFWMLVVSIIIASLGFAVYPLLHIAKNQKWCEFITNDS